MLQVRQRELHLGEGDKVMLRGSIRGQPKRRYNLKRGMRPMTPNMLFTWAIRPRV
jgi:hypothetical protein